MKKRLLLLSAMLAVIFTTAVADNVVSADPLTIAKSGTADLTINLKNTDKVSAVQFKLTLPEGVSVKASTDSYSGNVQSEAYEIAKGVVASLTDRTEDMMVMGNKTSDNTYIFVLISFSGKSIAPGEGGIMKITFQTDGGAESGNVTISDIHLAIEGSSVDVAQSTNVVTDLTVSDVLKGDVNNDGEVFTDDAVCILRHVVGKTNKVFNESAADVNGDGDIDGGDAVLILKYVVGKIPALSRGVIESVDWDTLDDPE